MQSSNTTVSNIVLSDSVCKGASCFIFDFNGDTNAPVTGITLNNVYPNTTFVPTIFEIFGLSGRENITTAVLRNTTITNVSGFNAAIVADTNIVIDPFFTYENVTTNGSVTPLFNLAANGITINVTTPLPSQMALSDIYNPAGYNCTINYLGFTFVSIPPLPTFTPNSSFPWVWIVVPVCVAVIGISAVVCFILYRKVAPAYSTIQ